MPRNAHRNKVKAHPKAKGVKGIGDSSTPVKRNMEAEIRAEITRKRAAKHTNLDEDVARYLARDGAIQPVRVRLYPGDSRRRAARDKSCERLRNNARS